MNITTETLIQFTTDASELPGKLKKLKARWSQKEDVTTIYATNKTTGLNSDLRLYSLLRALSGDDEKREAFLAKTNDGTVAELRDKETGNSQIIKVSRKKDGIIISAAESDANGVLRAYNADGNRKGTAILLALLPIFLEDAECQKYYTDTMEYIVLDPDDQIWDADPDMLANFGKNICRLSNNLYFRTRYAATAGDAAVSFDKNIKTLRNNEISKTKVILTMDGKPSFFKEPEKQAAVNATSGAELKGKYSILSRELTEDEKKLVPTMAPWYITPQWVETEAKMVQASKIFPIPFRSLLLYGVSGTGKTEGAKAIFSGLGLPAVSICCNVDMTMFDFLGQLIPNVNKYGRKNTEQVAATLNIPTYDDVENDFSNTYKQLFGTEPDEFATPADCYNRINEMMLGSSSDGEPDFIYVESEFVRAYKNGWGIEIQEPTIIKRNSVLAGLNKALDNDPEAASITLPTGEIIKRHPDCMVIMTTNQDYDGCNNIQQSVLSRMQNKRHISNPTQDELVERTLSETKFPDKKTLGTMASIVKEINEFCNKSDVTDGVCGPRELSNWAKRAYVDAVMNEENSEIKEIDAQYVLRAAFSTIIEKVSQVSEDQEAVVIEVIQKHYAEGDVMSAREEYMAGAA